MAESNIIEPQATSMCIVDFDTTIYSQVLPRGAGLSTGSRSALLFKNLPALIRYVRILGDLAEAWDNMLPEDHPLRSWEAPEGVAGPTSTEEVTQERSAIETLLEGIDLSGLDNPPAMA